MKKMKVKPVFKKMLVGATASIAAYFIPLLPHTTFLEEYKRIVTRYTLNREVPVEETIRKRLNEVMDDLKLELEERKLIKPFSVFGFDIFHAGVWLRPYQKYIGIPANFDYFDANYVNRDNILIDGELVDWSRKDAMLFLHSLVLSEDAQKYAIGREILKLKANEPLLSAIAACAIISVMSMFYNMASVQSEYPKIRPLYRRLIASLMVLFGIGCWIAIKDITVSSWDAEIDEELSVLGAKYIKGGKEFYEKQMQRNIALRSLLENQGKKLFAANGNEFSFLRRKTMPIADRKSFFDLKLQEIQQTV